MSVKVTSFCEELYEVILPFFRKASDGSYIIEAHNYILIAIHIVPCKDARMLPLIILTMLISFDPCIRSMPMDKPFPRPQMDAKAKLCRMPVCRNQSLPELPLCPVPNGQLPKEN